jgi:hypothetical protein
MPPSLVLLFLMQDIGGLCQSRTKIHFCEKPCANIHHMSALFYFVSPTTVAACVSDVKTKTSRTNQYYWQESAFP